eukprot:scaffold10108_cov117-Isochrysis_galbana.AAC.6
MESERSRLTDTNSACAHKPEERGRLVLMSLVPSGQAGSVARRWEMRSMDEKSAYRPNLF